LIKTIPHHIDKNMIVLEQQPPADITAKIWVLVHDDFLAGHLGTARTLHRARAAISWPGMESVFKTMTRNCPRCQKAKAVPNQPSELYTTRATAPFTSIFLDYIGPLRASEQFRYIPVILDRFSHFVSLTATCDTTAETTASILYNQWICVYGVPLLVTTDNGPSFTGEAFKNLVSRYHIQHHLSAPHHPQGHGAVERANRTVEQIIRTLIEGKKTWHQLVPSTAFAMNTAFSRVVGTSPFKIVHGFNPRLPIHAELGTSPEFPFGDEASEVPVHLITATTQLFQEVQRTEARVYAQARKQFLQV